MPPRASRRPSYTHTNRKLSPGSGFSADFTRRPPFEAGEETEVCQALEPAPARRHDGMCRHAQGCKPLIFSAQPRLARFSMATQECRLPVVRVESCYQALFTAASSTDIPTRSCNPDT